MRPHAKDNSFSKLGPLLVATFRVCRCDAVLQFAPISVALYSWIAKRRRKLSRMRSDCKPCVS
jgi:hypothetical protein